MQVVNTCNNIQPNQTTDGAKKAYSQASTVCNELMERIDKKTLRNVDTDAAAIEIMIIALNAYSGLNGGDEATRKHYGFNQKQLSILTQRKPSND